MTACQSGLISRPLEDVHVHELALIERPNRRSVKTPEEISQLTVDENLNDIDRAVYLLSAGQEVQRASVIANLPSLIRQNPAETFHWVVPKVREVLGGAGAEIQLAAAVSFLTILQDDIVLIHTHTYSILKTVLLHLNHRDAVVSNAWLETLLCAMDVLPKETIKQEVLRPLVFQSLPSHSLQTRLARCRILGKVFCKLDSHTVKKELMPLARSLCQDPEFEVRACMCRQLESIAMASGVDETSRELLPDLVDLARDGHSGVRLAALDAIINLMEKIDSENRLRVVVPLVMSVFQAGDAIMASLSFQFGKICSQLAGCLSDEQKVHLLQTFKSLCVIGLNTERNENIDDQTTLIRCNCCYNLPTMLAFADSTHFLSDLYLSFSSLCCDPEVSVRRSAAASFHQVVKLLSSNVALVHKELLILLKDDALEVLDALMNHLEETLEVVLFRGEKLTQDKKGSFQSSELLSALLLAEQKVGGSLRWRLHEKLLQRYSILAKLLPGEPLHQSLSPRIFVILTSNKVLPVQREAARMFCTFLRYNRKQEHRRKMMEWLIQALARGRSYWNRLRFLDVCEKASEIFSRKYFNRHFLIPALELVHDPVANVRYKLCQMLPRLRSSLRLPADKQLFLQLDFCVQKLLCTEKDKDVVTAIHKVVLDLDKMDLTEPFQRRKDNDVLDQKKETEETLLLEMEQLEHQQSEAKPNSIKQSERRRSDRNPSLSTTKSKSLSLSVSSSGKETRRVKLSRSRSLSSQPTVCKPDASQQPLGRKALSGSSGSRNSSSLHSKDDFSRTTHFKSPSTSYRPVLICSNSTTLPDMAASDGQTTTTLDQREDRTINKDHWNYMTDQRTSNVDHGNSPIEHKTMTMVQRVSALDRRTNTLGQRKPRTSALDQRDNSSIKIDSGDHRNSFLYQRSKSIDEHSTALEDSKSRKLLMKSNSFNVQSGCR
ncbi:serine/threonine-protein phosphatase 4 regulatory subunit 4 isoform X2 [Dunckerocampus dactyliophorus]|uniref:serine/threonine-protein phosphatase 4 regulatory subunit 4 isoform X2 n=1 Tax=Dunckerocampus dactyliophorus TaxID=161453 RepID=UPI002404E98F|nr:serine/threonine-protein phosphatase 4 regulatory subunit 4 isoform X2 [Dunckerocampus dactyliophorus]